MTRRQKRLSLQVQKSLRAFFGWVGNPKSNKEVMYAWEESRAVGQEAENIRSSEEEGMSKSRAARISNAQAKKSR